jgi:hypothetical protein
VGRLLVVVSALTLAAAAPTVAGASLLVARGLAPATLRVDGAGHALVSVGGRRMLAWGAVDARPPRAGIPQVAFSVRYGGFLAGGGCAPYDGPPLAWLVAACKAPDGSYWALQRWQRLRPNYGGTSGAFELRLSHWTGAIAQLEVGVDWAYRRFDHLYGRLTYRGLPVYGFRSTSGGAPLDAYGRNMYLDTLDSAYGHGWHRENSFLAQKPTGAFCYGFYPHRAGTTGRGTAYRITAIGPGVTPDVEWEGTLPGAYSKEADQQADAAMTSLLKGDKLCRPR